MKELDVQDLLEYSRAAVAILRSLGMADQTMTYGDFARAIGLIDGPDAKWKPWHRQQTEAILNATAAIEKLAGKKTVPLEYDRVINQRTQQPGAGVKKTSRIVRE